MHFRPSFIVGFGFGYLLGARAGRERYDVIMRQVRAVRERPEVQSAAGVVSAQASGFVERVRQTVGGRGGRGSSTGYFAGTVGAHSSNGSGAVHTS
ncbi:hypothetical protein [Frankia sp. Cppng1_Ct_nod]|uniref:hypothetical protein n=1 Tax=Frankia sp. Cppng1_Ct_nod TaxID=2897162 RepID=UPI001040FB70|nr:hypothetical protein [Frankia sp. Cppng1_Ct_nod]